MTPEQKTAVLGAVHALIEDEAADGLFEALNAVVSLAVKHPVALTGTASALNPLLDLSSSDFQAYLRVLDLVDKKRTEAGKEPLRRVSSGYDNTKYMKEFMAQKRERQRRAVEIENMARSERDKLIGKTRIEFMDIQSKHWLEERNALLGKVRSAHGGKLSRELQDVTLAQFWGAVDKQLDQKEEAARYRMRNPHGVTPDVDTLSALVSTLKHDPYKK